MIKIQAIRSAASSPAYTRGNQIYKNGKVHPHKLEENADYVQAEAVVEGSTGKEYQVELVYDQKKEKFERYWCACEAYQIYPGLCKHCVGFALELYYAGQKAERQVSETAPKAKATSPELAKAMVGNSMKEKVKYFQTEIDGKVELEPHLEKKGKNWTLEFKIGAEHKYVLKNITQFVEALQNDEWVEYGKRLAFYHNRKVFSAESRKLLDLLEEYVRYSEDALGAYYRSSGYGYSYGYYSAGEMVKRYLTLTDLWMVRFAEVFARTKRTIAQEGKKFALEFKEEDPVLRVKIEAEAEGGYGLTIPSAEVFAGLEKLCIRLGHTFYVCSQEFSRKMKVLHTLFQGKEMVYSIHPKDSSSFCASILPVLKECTRCTVPEALAQYAPKECRVQVYLDLQNGEFQAKVQCSYGDSVSNLLEDSLDLGELYRDMEKEGKLRRVMKRYFPAVQFKEQVFVLPEEDDEGVFLLMQEGITQIQQFGEVYLSDQIKWLQKIPRPRVSVGITLRSGILDVDIQSDQLPLEEMEAILADYRRKRKFHRLADGSFLSLEDNGLAAIAELAEGLELKGEELTLGHLQIPEYRSFYLDQVLREKGNDLQIKRSQEFKALIREMKNVEDSDFDVPEELNARLRSYQEFGFRWMMTLSRIGFGGILADDMGLGKTVQAIAYLLAQKNLQMKKNQKTQVERHFLALIVCPASLVYNWESELKRFAPSLSVCMVVGNAALRKEQIQGKEGDILLTSYDLLKRDIQHYENIHVEHMIIDEAQNIKNYTTQAAKTVKSVCCRHRFALTGTPIENSLSELWSIFDFLMPGLLSTNKGFKERYEQPIASGQDKRVMARLKKMIRPFILRRTKAEVLKELPDKIEKVIYSRMGAEQEKLYQANLQKLLLSLKQQSQEEFAVGKLQILAELTKLRQLCCDPAMVYSNYQGEAAKVETCMEIIRSAAAAKNQVLLFSQFTSALDILGKRLEKEKIPYYQLTGSTSKEKRANLVEAFHRDGTPVFLISLKAGGTGLNLTAASIVIHFDPWWNMAAQNQATDRAYRIGQNQVVTVYPLIMKDTLEEKIRNLQERKARLSDEVITGGSVRDTLATKEELLKLLGEE